MQKKYISIFCILLSIFALMCTAEAVDVYVSNTGNDAAAGTAEAPVKNLARAYAILGTNGGTIYVQDAVTVTATKTIVLSNRYIAETLRFLAAPTTPH